MPEVLELDLLLTDVANPDDKVDRFAVGVGPLLAGAEAQARLQSPDLLAPGGERLLLFVLLLIRCWFRSFLRSRLLLFLSGCRATREKSRPGYDEAKQQHDGNN